MIAFEAYGKNPALILQAGDGESEYKRSMGQRMNSSRRCAPRTSED
jgi:hypothetical protein